VSGGCVEKEILKQAYTVFDTGVSKMMTYDGRYRLGCEGTLYILIERFTPDERLLKAFAQIVEKRESFDIHSRFKNTTGTDPRLGSVLLIGSASYMFNGAECVPETIAEEIKIFKQRLKPCFRLMIVGAEHDAAQLSIMAASLGWEVNVVVSPSSPQVLTDFPGASALIKTTANDWSIEQIDANTAIVLMSHSYVKDLEFLFRLKNERPAYIGLLGPSNRRERMLNDLIEKYDRIDESFFDLVYGPAGLNIGAETPQEIALSICSEILSITRGQYPKSLKDKLGSIHLNTKL
jgi:xanthine/CO dehydrogenase XdhC/CoxF family maturation factor